MTARRTGTAALLTLTALAATATACGSADSANTSLFASGRVSVGVKSDQPGTSKLDHYQPLGFDITLANRLLKKLGAEPDFGAVPSEDRSTVLTGKKKDLVIATFSITTERMADLDFVGPYATTNQGVMVRKNDPRITKPADLNGKYVCAWPGTTSADTLKKMSSSIKVYEAPDASSCIEDLEKRKTADAVSTDQMILYGFTQEHPDLRVVPHVTLGPLNRYGIAMDKGHRDDCRALLDALRDYLTGSDWSQDFAAALPAIPRADPLWESHYKPRVDTLDAYSCRDKPAP
ncbi:transporter substrate-binding domain-containing protein [Streptomyces sp. RS10V-4]|uniref:transporter substrate-binding domain-containing protein n=1 Tax=Streptomyces rhizoryzae TaxID=2932493 RepID=UPI0020039904|nr:transporter substrate-binding domain-containing protein [Streptomyces rhizoryzae]MCK7627761.1 transporter substrate-binding domain-containing protein [Streptomyces rhizoryzae]